MAQGFMAGMTSYENQSITDIVKDISCWIEESKKTSEEIKNMLCEIKTTKFYSQIPYDYRAMIYEMPQICQTNIVDMQRVLNAIQSHTLAQGDVDLLWKVGKRAIINGDDNKKCYKSRDDGYWHDYDNPEFRMVETIYATFGDYCAMLWDVTNAASRLKDYIDIPKEITSMKIEDNSVNIGNGNNLKNNSFHSKNKTINNGSNETEVSKILWRIIVPIVVGVIVAAICVWLGLK